MKYPTKEFRQMQTAQRGIQPESGATEPNKQSRPKRWSSAKMFAMGILPVVATVGPLALDGGSGQQKTERGLLTQRYETVLSEIGSGQLDPTQLTQVTITPSEAGFGYSVAATVEGKDSDAVDPSDPTINEMIVQSGGDPETNNNMVSGDSKVILPIGVVKGHPQNLVQQAEHHQI